VSIDQDNLEFSLLLLIIYNIPTKSSGLTVGLANSFDRDHKIISLVPLRFQIPGTGEWKSLLLRRCWKQSNHIKRTLLQHEDPFKYDFVGEFYDLGIEDADVAAGIDSEPE
jgi:hypothetical protein